MTYALSSAYDGMSQPTYLLQNRTVNYLYKAPGCYMANFDIDEFGV